MGRAPKMELRDLVSVEVSTYRALRRALAAEPRMTVGQLVGRIADAWARGST